MTITWTLVWEALVIRVIEAARKGSKAVGLDVSIEGIKKARYFARLELGAKSDQCGFVVGLAENLPFRS